MAGQYGFVVMQGRVNLFSYACGLPARTWANHTHGWLINDPP
jgi:hypothetical protein